MKRIMVVDDDSSTLDVITLLFEMEGYEVLGLRNCMQLDQAITRFSPGIILMDVIMGLIDGRDICKELKNSRHRNIPVLLMSVVNGFYKDAEKPLFSDDFIEKPFDVEVMLIKVQALIGAAGSDNTA